MSRWINLHFGALVAFLVFMEMVCAVQISMTPRDFDVDKDKSVKIKCQLDDKEKEAEEIVFIKVSRKGDKALVLLDANNTLTYVTANEDEYKSKGSIESDSDIDQSFLDLEIKEPAPEDAGTYNCLVSFKDGTGEVFTTKASSKLTIDDPDVKGIKGEVDDLMKKVEEEDDDDDQSDEDDKEDDKKVDQMKQDSEEHDKQLETVLKKEKEVEKKVKAIEGDTINKLKKAKEVSLSEQKELKQLKEEVSQMMENVGKEGEEIKELEQNETGGKEEEETLEETEKEQGQKLAKLEENEKKIEQKVDTLTTDTKKKLKQIMNLAEKSEKDHTKLLELEPKINTQKTHLQEIEEKENDIEARVERLEERANALFQKIDGLPIPKMPISANNKKVTPIIAFAATNKGQFLWPRRGSKLVFPDIIMQTGRGYNSNTGIFTAPVRGLYAFHLVLKVNCSGCYLLVSLKAHTESVMQLKVGMKYDQNQGSATSPVKLERGATVVVHVDKVIDAPVLTTSFLCVFSGYLITNASS